MIPRALALALLPLAAASLAAAQVAVTGADTAVVVPDPGDVLGAAHAAQADFERRRARYFPSKLASPGGPCDEVVGRLCTWYGEGEWYPVPEREEVIELRAGLLAELDSLQRLTPGDGWVLGQRVWYRAEADDWNGALRVARACGSVERWWCAALEGLSLHGLRRYDEAARAFDRALARMDPELALEWRVPERAVDSDAAAVLATVVTAGDESLDLVLDRLWWLADPLYLVEGNDRLTAHYARWAVSTLKDGARNPFQLRWGNDLEELTVRHGWEIGWERSRGYTLGGADGVVGHKHPEARDYMPPGRALGDPSLATAEDLIADRTRPSSLYAPPYAPVLLPMEGQLAVFPRGDRMAVVATYHLPEDTTFHADHEHERVWMAPGDQTGMEDRIGLFAVPVDGGPVLERRDVGSTDGALLLEAPVGAYLLSAESWSPERRRAGRLRAGTERERAPEDVATLSDLLLLAPNATATAPGSLPEVLPDALPRAEIRAGQGLAIAWEVSGLGFRPETFQFEVSVERTDRNVLRRLGEFLRIADRSPSLALTWEEPGPDSPTHHFRHLDLALPEMDPGRYEIALTLRTAGRSDVTTTRTFTVVDP